MYIVSMPDKNSAPNSRMVRPDMTFQDAITAFCGEKSRELSSKRGTGSSNTVRDYRSHLRGFLHWYAGRKAYRRLKNRAGPKISRETLAGQLLPDIKLSEITAETINEYFTASAKRKKSSATISTWLYAFKSFYKVLSRLSSGRVSDITPFIRKRAYTYKKAPHLTPAHARKFLKHLASVPHDPPVSFRNKVFFSLMIKFGLKMKEALRLKERDIEFQQGHVVLAITGTDGRKRFLPLPLYEEGHDKKGRARLVPLKSNLDFAELLREFLQSDCGRPWFRAEESQASKKKEPYIFLSTRRTRLCHDVMRNEFISIMSALRLDKYGYTPHSLRHTAVANWLSSGVDLETASKLAGHSSVSTTERIYAAGRVKKLSEGLAKSL